MTIRPENFGGFAQFDFGYGEVQITNGVIDGRPVVILTPLENPVPTGSNINDPSLCPIENPEIMAKSIVLTFRSDVHANAVDDTLNGFVEHDHL